MIGHWVHRAAAQRERGGCILGGMATGMTWLLRLLAAIIALLVAAPLAAHPAPFSYLDLTVEDDRIDGTFTFHVIDAARELGLADSSVLLEPGEIAARAAPLEATLAKRLTIGADSPRIEWLKAEPLPNDGAVRLTFRIAGKPAGSLALDAAPFPYDPLHQSFVNVYEGGQLRQQLIFGRGAKPHTYYRGTTSGVFAVLGTFTPSGIHHIWIGADHLLFLFGLLLLGGSWKRLAAIVTAFTVGHSITLSLAALDIVNPPARVIEPLIALTIVVVGLDNLFQWRRKGRDLRPWEAGFFGLIHGFGFAGVLREFGLPQGALGWSLFGFNVGVELGQLAVVLLVAGVLALVRRQWPRADKWIVVIGSLVVAGGGTYWFLERTVFA